jgi:hypothetical protein
VFWITEYTEAVPAAPVWAGPTPPTLDTTPNGTNVVLRWSRQRVEQPERVVESHDGQYLTVASAFRPMRAHSR